MRTVTFNVAKLQELRDRVQKDIDTIYSPTDMSNESEILNTSSIATSTST